ncbi:hypothetical protein LBMAG55_16280 [Verrucomicrobiota bacterium]|nr:hypothetical protein LBMAG55_16280 [Verrucomicrobiota bacterium]
MADVIGRNPGRQRLRVAGEEGPGESDAKEEKEAGGAHAMSYHRTGLKSNLIYPPACFF